MLVEQCPLYDRANDSEGRALETDSSLKQDKGTPTTSLMRYERYSSFILLLRQMP